MNFLKRKSRNEDLLFDLSQRDGLFLDNLSTLELLVLVILLSQVLDADLLDLFCRFRVVEVLWRQRDLFHLLVSFNLLLRNFLLPINTFLTSETILRLILKVDGWFLVPGLWHIRVNPTFA